MLLWRGGKRNRKGWSPVRRPAGRVRRHRREAMRGAMGNMTFPERRALVRFRIKNKK